MHPSRYLLRPLPEPLKDLAGLAIDMRWSWNHSSDVLWRMIDPELWEATGNPWLILESVSQTRLEILAKDKKFLDELNAQTANRTESMEKATWFADSYGTDTMGPIAYFSMEFGLSEALPIYSGGLGVLAGDYLKTASDMGVPLVGIGLLYQQGYFRQTLDASGNQLEFYPYNDPAILPIIPVRNSEGDWLRLKVCMPGRDLILRAWEVQVGRNKLYLLDSNDPLNTPGDRGITGKLYGGGEEMRLQQEIALGIGGWRLLEVLGIKCDICHLNEGHAAFAVLERARAFMRNTGQPFEISLRCTRAGNIFTTHTPVKAAFDSYPTKMIERYAIEYGKRLGIDSEELLGLGRANPDDDGEPFNMAYLALRGAGAINGVSKLHGKVSRRIFSILFPRWPEKEIPVGHVTNAVHTPSWDSEEADKLWTMTCGKERWIGTLKELEKDFGCVDDKTLWTFRSKSRIKLIEFVRHRLARQRAALGLDEQTVSRCLYRLDPNLLTMGFARRFTAYKRPNLLLHDPDRLASILNNPAGPAQLIIAGKAHPYDSEGRAMIRQWAMFLKRPDVRGRVVFIQDYDMIVASQLVQGIDLWINTPRRPWEASGTSGMKVLVNGGINLSELDGWWAEAYCPEAGWAIGDGKEHDSDPAWDAREAEELYSLLEHVVIPAFYTRNAQGIPTKWVEKMRASMAHLTPLFSSNRMIRQYTEEFYLKCSKCYKKRVRDNGRLGAELEAWKAEIARHWSNVHFGSMDVKTADGFHQFNIQIYTDDLNPDYIKVELYAEPLEPNEKPEKWPFTKGPELEGAINGYLYSAKIPSLRPTGDYTARIIPYHRDALMPLEDAHILWQH